MIIEIVAQFVVDVLFISTGELILCAITLGKHRPIWKPRRGRKVTKFIILSNASAVIGLAFWLIAGFLIGWMLL